jgi:hypothetical protein
VSVVQISQFGLSLLFSAASNSGESVGIVHLYQEQVITGVWLSIQQTCVNAEAPSLFAP